MGTFGGGLLPVVRVGGVGAAIEVLNGGWVTVG